MSDIQPEYQFFMALVVGITGFTLLSNSPSGYINFILLILLFGIIVITRTWQDRGFFMACGGEPLVIACSVMNIWAGLFTACMLAGIVCGALGLLKSRLDIRFFACFCGSSFIIALLIYGSNHVLLPLLLLSSIAVVIILIQSIRSHQFRKYYSGG